MNIETRFDLLKTRDRLQDNQSSPSVVMMTLNSKKSLQEAELIKQYSIWKKI